MSSTIDDALKKKKSSNDFGKVMVFMLALMAGTVCSLTSKIMLSLKSTGITNEIESFSFPLFQTFAMFFGMSFGLLMDRLVLQFNIPFPGYVTAAAADESRINRSSHSDDSYDSWEDEKEDDPISIPLHMYFYLAIPAVFDLIATILCMYGLLYITVSTYQILRGSAIVFVALTKQFIFKDLLKRYMWIGIGLNVLSIALVGFTAMLIDSSSSAADVTADTTSTSAEHAAGSKALVGVTLILLGALTQSFQYVFEEKVMTGSSSSSSVKIPPLLLIGMEGLWGFLICLFVLYPLAYYCPGNDHGSFENGFNTYTMLANSSQVQSVFTVYFISVFFYNALACLVTVMLDSVWRAILDNFRPATVWMVDLFIFYYVSTSFGEQWNASWSWLQLVGMITLLYGTAIYNAPNGGSVKLMGGIWSCYIDCSDEYAVQQEDRMPPISCEEEVPLHQLPSIPPPSPSILMMSPLLRANSFHQKNSKKVPPSYSNIDRQKRDYGSVDIL